MKAVADHLNIDIIRTISGPIHIPIFDFDKLETCGRFDDNLLSSAVLNEIYIIINVSRYLTDSKR